MDVNPALTDYTPARPTLRSVGIKMQNLMYTMAYVQGEYSKVCLSLEPYSTLGAFMYFDEL
jgi:hypothetical protein